MSRGRRSAEEPQARGASAAERGDAEALPGPRWSPGPRTLLAILVVVAVGVTAVAHWPALSATARCFDDDLYVTDNHLVSNPSLESVARFFKELRPSTVGGYYQPLAMTSLMLDVAMGGSLESALPFHRTSLLLHLACTALLVVVLYQLLRSPWVAAAAGLLFSVHPLTVEAIPWVAERKTLLATFFALCSVSLYVAFVRARGERSPERPLGARHRVAYAGALVAYALALLAKATVTSLPAMLLLLGVWPLGGLVEPVAAGQGPGRERSGSTPAGARRRWRLGWGTLAPTLPFFAVGLLSAAVTYVSQRDTGRVALAGETYSPWLTLGYTVFFYARRMVWPAHLTPHNPFPQPFSLANPVVLWPLLGSLALVAALLVSLRWTRALLTGWAVFLVGIFPALGILVRFTDAVASDKYAYFPALGILLGLGWALSAAWDALPRWLGQEVGRGAVVALVVAAVSLELGATRAQLAHWQTSETLARRMVAETSAVAEVHYELGNALRLQAEERLAGAAAARQAGDEREVQRLTWRAGVLRTEALESYLRAVELRPRYAEALNNIAYLLEVTGRHSEAKAYWAKVIQVDPGHYRARVSLGFATQLDGEQLLRAGDAEAGRRLLEQALSLYQQASAVYRTSFAGKGRPEDPRTLALTGDVLVKLGRFDEGAPLLGRALVEASPPFLPALPWLGQALVEQRGLGPEVASEVGRLLERQPDAAFALLAQALLARGNRADALLACEVALRMNPGNQTARALAQSLAGRREP